MTVKIEKVQSMAGKTLPYYQAIKNTKGFYENDIKAITYHSIFFKKTFKNRQKNNKINCILCQRETD